MLFLRKKRLFFFFSLLFIIMFGVSNTNIIFASDNTTTCPDGSQPTLTCPTPYTLDNATKECTTDPKCSVGQFVPDAGMCLYPPENVNGQDVCDGGSLMNYGGQSYCGDVPTCPSGGSISGKQCVLQPQPTCNLTGPTGGIEAYKKFCTKRCYDARTDYPQMTDLNSDISSDINKTFNIDVKKGFSGWGLLRPYSDGCFLKGKFQLCVSGGGTTLTLSFTFPDGTVKTVSGPLQAKYWNTYSWSVNPNIIGLVVRQHGTNTVTFHYDDLIYKPLDNDTVGGHYSFNETFTPMKNDPYDFYFVELQPGTLEVNPNPFCSEQIAMCFYDFASSHAWTEYGRVFFSGSVAHDITQSQVSMSTYYRNNTQEAVFNTGEMFMSTADHPERGGAYRMWYDYLGDNATTTTVPPTQGCPDQYGLNSNGVCVSDGICSSGTYDGTTGKCVSDANLSCPDQYTYNPNADTCTADASCPGSGTINASTNLCETYLGTSCPGTYNIQGNECVGDATCPSGTTLNPDTGKCEKQGSSICPDHYTIDSSLNKCVAKPVCPNGTTPNASGQCVAQPQCSTTSGSCSAVHQTATKLYANSAYGYSLSQMKFFSPSINETDLERCGDDSVKLCINGSCTSCIPFCSGSGESSKVYVGFKSGIHDEDDYTHVTNAHCPGSPYEYIDIKSGWSGGVPYIQPWKTCSNGDHKWTYLSYAGTNTEPGQNVYAYFSEVEFGDSKDANDSLYDTILYWYVYTFNDHGIQNCGIELEPSRAAIENAHGSFGSSGFYIEGQSNSYSSSAIYAYVPYKCSATGTAYKTKSECQNNCTATTCTCPAHTTKSGNECIAQLTCPAGGTYDPDLKKCTANITHCPSSDYTYDSSSNTCQLDPSCTYGTFDTNSDKCVVQSTTSCESPYTQNGDKCTTNPQCPGSGSYNTTLKKCTADITSDGCPSQSTYNNGKCLADPTCPGNGTWNSTDKKCETGTTLTCPSGYTLSGGTCIPTGGGGTPSDVLGKLTQFGITQTNAQDNVTEEFGMYFPVKTLTAVNEGFIRKPSDFPSDEKQGYASNRHNDWLDFDTGALNYFFQDTGKDPGTCPSGQVTTDDGCFKDQADLCPSGQVELYPDYKGQCFQYIEYAACWNGQTQFGNQCFKKLSNTPNVCPSDGRSYTLLTPTTADYICKTTTQPSCPSGDIRDGNTCYKTSTPSCPNGYTRQGGSCIKTQPASCPNGTVNINGSCYYTQTPACPSGYYLSGNRQCAKDEWISGEVDDCYDANWNIIQFGQEPQCPSGTTQVARVGRWHPVDGQVVGTCSSVAGTKNTAVGTHYAICHATANATCPSGYSFSSDYQVNGSFTALGHSHDYYNKSDNSLIKFGDYRWDYNESSVSCGSLYNHTYTCYDSASVYGGFVDSTIENENATRICFNTSYRNCTAPSDGCVKYDTAACQSPYTWDGTECKQTITACPGSSYDSSDDKCINYDRQACDISPYDWTYDSANDICVYETNAQCSPGERKKADGAQWSACYQLDIAYGQPPGHIYCRNNYTYWDYSNKERCYQKKGTACNGQYQDEPNPDVIIGSGNQYNEWTGKCWLKTKDLCGSGELYGRGKYQPSGVYHCLKKNFKYDYITPDQVTANTLSQYMCSYILHGNLNVDASAVCWKADIDNSTDVWYDFNNPHAPMDDKYRPICPIDKSERCTWLGGSLEVCGTNKACAGCKKIPQNNSQNDYVYGDIEKIAYHGNAIFGLSYSQMLKSDAEKIAATLLGRLPTASEKTEISQAFQMSLSPYWLSTDQSDMTTYKYLVIVWDGSNKGEAGFVAPCVYDNNGDMLCTGDMIKCVNGQCPYGSQYLCQPYNGAEYCSHYSNTCLSLANPSNGYTYDNITNRDKKPDGKYDNKTGKCLGQIYIFNGKTQECRKRGIKTLYTDCCSKAYKKQGKILLILPQCNKEDAQTDQLVQSGVCHEVGTYCKVKFLGICLQKAKTYCCFHSKLGRIIQEQGRSQLKDFDYSGDWGDPKSPNCRGFTPDEFQMLDFNKIDLKEYFGDLAKKIAGKAQQIQQKATQKIQNFYKNTKLNTPSP